MSTSRLGVVRKSMRTNPLLIKAPLGQTQSRGFSLPPPDFTYGVSSPSGDGGVAEALSSWRVQSSPARPRRAVPDFVSLNQDAAQSGLVTAKEVSQYRAQRGKTSHTATSEPTSRPQQGRRAQAPVVPDIRHGITTRVSSPISDLLSHHYGRRWIETQQGRNQTNNQAKNQRIKAGCIPDTRTSLLRRTRAQTHTDTHTAVTLPRLRQVPPSLDTFRTEEERCRAFRARH